VIGTSDGGGRLHTGDRHEASTNLLGHLSARTAGDAARRGGLPADSKTALMHDITDRGFIAAGKVADITIFDPDTITEKPREPVATLPAGGVQVQREAVGSKGVSTRCVERGAAMVTPVFVAPLCGGARRRRTRRVPYRAARESQVRAQRCCCQW
jgi:N-acyl-D-aspartate/D-glutamate deacylase